MALLLGIDSYAHLGTLLKQSNGKTIAVLGSGIDKIYPKENIELAREIVKNGGCIVSEYPVGTSASKLNFPQRNRIISGLSKGVVVVEAAIMPGERFGVQCEIRIDQLEFVRAVKDGRIFAPKKCILYSFVHCASY